MQIYPPISPPLGAPAGAIGGAASSLALQSVGFPLPGCADDYAPFGGFGGGAPHTAGDYTADFKLSCGSSCAAAADLHAAVMTHNGSLAEARRRLEARVLNLPSIKPNTPHPPLYPLPTHSLPTPKPPALAPRP